MTMHGNEKQGNTYRTKTLDEDTSYQKKQGTKANCSLCHRVDVAENKEKWTRSIFSNPQDQDT
jgi:hypothetical protein